MHAANNGNTFSAKDKISVRERLETKDNSYPLEKCRIELLQHEILKANRGKDIAVKKCGYISFVSPWKGIT
jgi:hypothetical protein